MMFSMEQTIKRITLPVILLPFMVVLLLTGTQCAPEFRKEALKLPDKGPVVIAAMDSPADAKSKANLVCDGIDDNKEIQAVIDELEKRGGGEVILLKGTYTLANQIYLRSRVSLQGQGYDTLLIPNTSKPPGLAAVIRISNKATDVKVSNLRADANGGARWGIDVIGSSKRVIVEDCWVYNALDDEITATEYAEDVIIRNNTAQGKTGGGGHSNIEIGDGAKRVTVSDNTLLGGHKDRMGIQANYHVGELPIGEDFKIINNTLRNIGSHGMNLTANRVTVANNIFEDVGGYGINATPGEEYNITNNTLRNVNQAGIAVGGDKSIVTGNQIFEAKGAGISVVGGKNITISNNVLENKIGGGGISVYAPEAEVNVVNNRVSNTEYALGLGRDRIPGEVLNKIVVKDNDFGDSSLEWLHLAARVKNLEVDSRYAGSVVDFYDYFKAPLPASINHIYKAISGTGSSKEITADITNPDYPRNISITATKNSAISGYVIVEGTNAGGSSQSEEIPIIAGGTAYSNKAFATVTKIKLPSELSPADTVEIGIADKLGLSYPISATTDVYKVTIYLDANKWQNYAANEISGVDSANGTINFATIPVSLGVDFPTYSVQYKTHLTLK